MIIAAEASSLHPFGYGRTPLAQPRFLPMSRGEMRTLGWDELDVLLISGDAYVDHPSFGSALLGRLLVAHGYRVGVVAQPRWKDDTALNDLQRMGRPRLLAGVTAGALDSLLAHYTAFRKKRSDDAYTPGGLAGSRPNRATLVYTGLVRRAFPGLPVVIGGMEASLRRASHYDFWSDSLRRSILLDSKADLLCYGMAERALLEALNRLDIGDGRGLTQIPGTAWAPSHAFGPHTLPHGEPVVELPSHEAIAAESAKLMDATLAMERQVHDGRTWATQRSGDRIVVIAPPAPPLDAAALDTLHELPFSRAAHPAYTSPIPAVEMIRDSLVTHRGCGGGCSFCALALHQGRRIASRSRDSILREAQAVAATPGFRGSISDVGGPSANMWGARCEDATGKCTRSSCLTPAVCPKLKVDQRAILDLLRAVRSTPGVRHLRVASGIRYDLALKDVDTLAAFIGEFVGGQLKIAPEHVSPEVVRLMRKPKADVFERLLAIFTSASKVAGKEQYVVPYLMSGHPGCTDQHMEELARWLASRGWRPQQVQCFVPLPGTTAAAMYFAGIDTKGHSIAVARTDAQRLRQHGRLLPAAPRDGAQSTAMHKKGRGERANPSDPSHKPARRRPSSKAPAGSQSRKA